VMSSNVASSEARFRGGPYGEWFQPVVPTWMNPIRSFLAHRSNSLNVPLIAYLGWSAGESQAFNGHPPGKTWERRRLELDRDTATHVLAAECSPGV